MSKLMTLGDVTGVVAGVGFPKEMQGRQNGSIPVFKVGDISAAWLQGKNFLTESRNYLSPEDAKSLGRLVPAGATVFAKIGEALRLNRRVMLGCAALVDNNVMGLVPNEALVSPKYFYYFMQTVDLGDFSRSTTVPSIRKSDVLNIPINVPGLAEQDEIVAELETQFSRLDEAVANLQRVKANLKRYKASVLKAAVEGRLVETEASIAQREGRSYETGEQLLQRILEERRAKWTGRGKYKEPELPRIDHTFELSQGWAWATLGHLSLSVNDGPHYSPKYVDDGIPFISGGNVRPEGIDFSSTKYISKELHQELSKRCKPEIGDLLYTKGGTTGIARINTDPREFNVWVHVAVLKLTKSLHRFYVQHALNSQHCYRQAQEYTHGVGNQDLGLTRMVWITVPLPPLAEQARIVAEVDRHLSIIRGVEAEVDVNIQRSQALRQATLSKYFSSKKIAKRVPRYEK